MAQPEIQTDTRVFTQSTPAIAHALSDQQISSWRENGFALVHDLLPDVLLTQARDDAAAHYPAANTREAEQFDNFGSGQKFVFPSQSAACNDITLHPDLLAGVAALLDVDETCLRLTQSDLWPKYGREPGTHDHDNQDQRIHCDFPNHTLTHPPQWDTPEAVEIIIYLSDYDGCEGATAVVPRTGADDPAYPWPIMQTPGVGELQYINDKGHAERYLSEQAPAVAQFREEHLYQREKLARYQFGSVLFYRHDTWHRGTPVLAGTRRLVLNLTFKKADAEWVNILHPGWSWSMYRRNQYLENLIAKASVQQRCVLGFPAPGNAYWNEQTIAAVGARYAAQGIDMTPYRAASNG